jgi:hypothetical protein
MKKDSNEQLYENEKGDPTFSALTMSIASSALISMGLAPQEDGSPSMDKNLARFNIDLLVMLKEKTRGNLSRDEEALLVQVVTDLQRKFIDL